MSRIYGIVFFSKVKTPNKAKTPTKISKLIKTSEVKAPATDSDVGKERRSARQNTPTPSVSSVAIPTRPPSARQQQQQQLLNQQMLNQQSTTSASSGQTVSLLKTPKGKTSAVASGGKADAATVASTAIKGKRLVSISASASGTDPGPASVTTAVITTQSDKRTMKTRSTK